MFKVVLRGVVFLTLAVSMVVATAPAPVGAQGPDATVNVAALNLRAGPSTGYEVIGRLLFGSEVTLLARNETPEVALWAYVRLADGQEGWVSADFLALRADLDPLNLPVREAPALAGVAEDEAAAAPVQTLPAGEGLATAPTTRSNFRVGPGTNYQVITTLATGTPLLAQGRNAAATWVFATVNEQQGWIFGQLVSLSAGDIGTLPVTDVIVPSPTGAVAAAAGAPAVAPVAVGRGLTGFGVGGHIESFAYPDLMRQAGMTWVKRQIHFSPGAPGTVAAGAIDQAHGQGFNILLGVVGNANDVIQPGYFEDFARFLGEVAALGPDAIEVWNEQNIDREWANGHIDPNRYTQMLALAYNAIKSANPNVAVISGAPAPTGAEGAFGTAAVWNDDRYIRGMAAAGAARYMDCIGAHYNEGIVPPSWTSGDPRGNYYTRYFWGMVNTYYNAFGGARPVCFTELGYLSPEGFGPLPGNFAWGADTSVGEQAQWLAEAVRLARGSGRVRMVIIWNVDFTVYGDDPQAGYAIVRPGGGCPACQTLAAVR